MQAGETVRIIIVKFCDEVLRLDICWPFLGEDKCALCSHLHEDVPFPSRYIAGASEIDRVSHGRGQLD
jgi:hypothetical protein